jgi:hypothetical protein
MKPFNAASILDGSMRPWANDAPAPDNPPPTAAVSGNVAMGSAASTADPARKPRRQRLAAGLLRQIGVTEGIVSSREGYVETAVHFAQRCRRPKARARCRESMSAAAAKADGNLAAVRSIERTLIAAVEAP